MSRLHSLNYFPPGHDLVQGDMSRLIKNVNIIGILAVAFGAIPYTGVLLSFDLAILVLYTAYRYIYLQAAFSGQIPASHRKAYKPVAGLIKARQFVYIGAKFRVGLYAVIVTTIALFLGSDRAWEAATEHGWGMYFHPYGVVAAVLFMGVYVHVLHYRDRITSVSEFYQTVEYVRRSRGLQLNEARHYAYDHWYAVRAEMAPAFVAKPVAAPAETAVGKPQDQPNDNEDASVVRRANRY